MANQVTPKAMLQIQLKDWKMLLAQLEANPKSSTADVAYSKSKVEQLTQELADLTLE